MKKCHEQENGDFDPLMQRWRLPFSDTSQLLYRAMLIARHIVFNLTVPQIENLHDFEVSSSYMELSPRKFKFNLIIIEKMGLNKLFAE